MPQRCDQVRAVASIRRRFFGIYQASKADNTAPGCARPVVDGVKRPRTASPTDILVMAVRSFNAATRDLPEDGTFAAVWGDVDVNNAAAS